MNTKLPHFDQRVELFRPNFADFNDLKSLVNAHFAAMVGMDQFLGPYNARQRNSQFPYVAPTREQLNESVKHSGMNEIIFSQYVSSIIKFCGATKGMQALPLQHPSTIHSAQLSEGTFKLTSQPAGVTMIEVMNIRDPIYVRGLRNVDKFKFLILQQRNGKLGTASVVKWDALFFNQSHGFIPTWIDSNLNARFTGLF